MMRSSKISLWFVSVLLLGGCSLIEDYSKFTTSDGGGSGELDGSTSNGDGGGGNGLDGDVVDQGIDNDADVLADAGMDATIDGALGDAGMDATVDARMEGGPVDGSRDMILIDMPRDGGPTMPLTVSKTGMGSGLVTTVPLIEGKIECGPSCDNQTASFPMGSRVTLYPLPSWGSAFESWESGCDTTASISGVDSCTVNMTSAKTVRVRFKRNMYSVTVSSYTHASSTVAVAFSETSLGDCTATLTNPCEYSSVPFGATINVTPSASLGERFAAWTGNLSGNAAPASIRVDRDMTITGNFGSSSQPIAFVADVAGRGTVTSTDAPMSCPDSSCAFQPSGTISLSVMGTFAAMPGPGVDFMGWNGACSGSTTTRCNATWTVSSGTPVLITPKFVPSLRTLNTTFDAPSGRGSIRAIYADGPNPVTAMYPCPSDNLHDRSMCSGQFPFATRVMLRAQAESGVAFDSWSNCDMATADLCFVIMDDARTSPVTAKFVVR